MTRQQVLAFRTSRKQRIRVLVLVGIAATSLVLTQTPVPQALSAGTDWAHVDEAGHTSDEAEDQTPAECEGTFGIPFGSDPGWVRVGGSPYPTTPFVKAEGQVLVENGNDYIAQQSFITHTDNPVNHFAHDINAFLVPDPGYRHLLSNGSFEEGVGNEHAKMEIEWERGGIPSWAFPSPGDRLTVWGPHVWDCGHGDTWLGGDNTYRTEIHPPVGWVVYRHTADANGLPDTEAKRTRNPWSWYGSDDLPGHAERLASTGLQNTPVEATVADAFFSSWGGDIPEALNGCDTDDGDTPCTQNSEWHQNLRQQDYSFFVPAPPAPVVSPTDPAGAPVLTWEAEDRCATVPSNPGNPPGDDVEEAGEADSSDDTAVNIGSPTCGTIPTTVVPTTDTYGRQGIQVTVQASQASEPSNGFLAFAKRYKLAWDFVPAPSAAARTYTVSFNTMRVWNDSEPCGEDAEWVVTLRVNDKWIHPVRGHGDDNAAFWESGAVDDDLCDGGDVDYNDYSIGESLTVTLPPGEPINVWARGWDNDTVANDFIPVINDFRSGAGSWSTRNTIDGEGDWEIFYSITEVPTVWPTQGSLSVGSPTYGPNVDTGGTATRISAASVVELSGSDAAKLQYRYWPVADTAPISWLYDTAGPFRIDLDGSGAADGRYVVQYAPVSSGGIVGPRRATVLELDSTAPSLDVPANMKVDATSAAGTVVNYTTTATDNLLGPVTTTCDKPSGTFFPIRTVTTVTCTAKDAVDNSTTKTFTIEVVSPFGYIPDFAVLSERWTRLGTNVVVDGGNIGAFTTSAGPPDGPGFEVKIGNGTRLLNGAKIAAETVLLGDNVRANDVFNVNGIVAGVGSTYTARNGYVPLFLGMPAVPSFTAGTTDVMVSRNVSLPPGSYGKLTVKAGYRLTLTGGTYSFSSVDIGSKSQLLAAAASVVRVAGRMVAASNAVVRPTAPQAAPQLTVYVTGVDSPTTNQNAAVFGTDTTIIANIYVPSGTLQFGQHSLGRGGFLGRQVDVGNDARLSVQSAFDYP